MLTLSSLQVVRKHTKRPEKSGFTSYVLTKVLRNTSNIYEAYKHFYRNLLDDVVSVEESQLSNKELSPPIVDHGIYGLSPQYIPGENVYSLISTLKEWYESKAVPYSDMAVITETATAAANIRKVLEEANIKSEDAVTYLENKYKVKGKPGLCVESYQRFKGLEARLIIFFIQKGWEPQDVDIYVTFSRSFCHLIVIGTSKIIEELNQNQVLD